MEKLHKSLKSLRNPLLFEKSKVEIRELLQLDAADYIDLYFGDASDFSTVSNVAYAWQKRM